MSLSSDIKFQKTLALSASASNEFEAEAAELAARRLMAKYNIDPTDIPDWSIYSAGSFADNPLLKKLRDEWREQYPLPVVARHSWILGIDKTARCRRCGLLRHNSFYVLPGPERSWSRAPTCPPEPPREREQADNEKRKTAPPAFNGVVP